MTDSFIRERITELRIKKGVSEYKMSTDLGHSKSYIQSITSGRSLPSLGEFLYICDYLSVTPKEFFDQNISEPLLLRQLINLSKNMSDKDLLALINIADRLNEKQKIIDKQLP
ncbi:MAG TPA: helix-turn-helix domain-containing protein [Candidatus Mediterraneibacter surreyensis]|nr:helix-turn-helix domain-containing protein [Candidatus Mediterraneibacter surreyensis]